MSVRSALFTYLTDRADLPGLPAVLFERPRVVGGLTLRCRNDARRWLRDRVGDAIYAQRRPRDAGHTSITLRTASTFVDHGIDGAAEGTLESLTAIVYARGGDAALRADNVADLLRVAVDGFHGGTWGTTEISECLLDSQSTRETPPPDGSDAWEFEVAQDYAIWFTDEAAPVYAVDNLLAMVTFVDAYNQGDALRLTVDGSTIPVGRSITTLTWTVRTGTVDGAVAVTITGHPDAATGLANVTGTKGSPAISRSHYGLAGVAVFVSLSITDDAGTVSTAEGSQNG